MASVMGSGIFQNQLSGNGIVIWEEDNMLDRTSQFNDSCQVFAGETLSLYSNGMASGGQIGIGPGSSQQIVLEVVPEPATLLLLGLGGLMLRKMK